MKTPFYELAEKIDDSPSYFAVGLYNLPIDQLNYFADLFYSYGSYIEHRRYGINSHRIIMLLFADLLWQDEMKGGGNET